ncbi:MAG: NAD-dependent epimerase/dehydratase family protein [Vagococcus sp.]|uniref:NAD-dependent epimerase/dehydratase family protein n=1 Tax=Vagococcus TaxID=2737 RepID=UPI002FC5F25E
MMIQLVVFGGSGFVGQALCQEAIKQNIPVISISKHGQPKKSDLWMSHPLITWVKMDIFRDDSWKKYLTDSTVCINLIGILFENKRKGLTYEKMIVRANRLIISDTARKNIPYIFLSAKGGPKGYVNAKKEAEKYILEKRNPSTIIRSGLIVDHKFSFRYAQGLAVRLGNKLPLISEEANKVYPTSLNHLVHTILNEARNPQYKIIEDIR